MSPRFSIRPLATLADRRLAELAASGDERAFEVLIRRHRVELERYCWRLGLPDHHAEDVLQQAFTRAWMALRRGSDVGQPRAWLYRIVHNAALNAHRSARLRTHESIDAAVEGSLALAPADDLETRLLAMDALRHVAALPQMQRRAVVMTAIQGRSHEEAAGELGVTDGAVRGLLHRARTKLRAAAAALTPQGLLELLGRSGSGGALAGPPLEVGAGMAGAGLAGVVAKGAAVTAIAGLLAGGAVSQLGGHHRHAPSRPAGVTGPARASAASVAAAAPAGRDTRAGTSGRSGRDVPGGSRHGGDSRHGSGSRESNASGRGDGTAELSSGGREDRGTRGGDGGLRTRSSGGDDGARTLSVSDGGGSPSSGGSDGSGRHGGSTASGQQVESGGSGDVSGGGTSGHDESALVPESSSGPSLSLSGGGQTSDGGGSGGSGSSGGSDGSAGSESGR